MRSVTQGCGSPFAVCCRVPIWFCCEVLAFMPLGFMPLPVLVIFVLKGVFIGCELLLLFAEPMPALREPAIEAPFCDDCEPRDQLSSTHESVGLATVLRWSCEDGKPASRDVAVRELSAVRSKLLLLLFVLLFELLQDDAKSGVVVVEFEKGDDDGCCAQLEVELVLG